MARQRSSPAISLRSSCICVQIAHFDVINGVASEKATSVTNHSKLLTRWQLPPFIQFIFLGGKKATHFLLGSLEKYVGSTLLIEQIYSCDFLIENLNTIWMCEYTYEA